MELCVALDANAFLQLDARGQDKADAVNVRVPGVKRLSRAVDLAFLQPIRPKNVGTGRHTAELECSLRVLHNGLHAKNGASGAGLAGVEPQRGTAPRATAGGTEDSSTDTNRTLRQKSKIKPPQLFAGPQRNWGSAAWVVRGR